MSLLMLSVFIISFIKLTGIKKDISTEYDTLKRNCTISVLGTITDVIEEKRMERRNDNKGTHTVTMYIPVVSYLLNGFSYTEKAKIYSNTAVYSIGSTVNIKCSCKNPKDFIMETNDKDFNTIRFILSFLQVMCVLAVLVHMLTL